MATTKEKRNSYYEDLANGLKSVSPQNAVTPTGSGEEDDYYTSLKNEAYKSMLSKEVQAANAQDQALKYVNNGVQANGFGTQGVAESTNLGIANQYLSGLRNAQTEYGNEISGINQQQRAEEVAKANDSFEGLTTLMSGSTSAEQLDSIMKTYGYINEKGELDEAKLSKLDENSRNQLSILYNMYSSELKNNDFLSTQTLNGTAFRDSATANDNIVDAKGGTGKLDDELEYIFSPDYMKGKQDGFVVRISTDKDKDRCAYMIYHNGAWYQTTAQVFANATNKDDIFDK